MADNAQRMDYLHRTYFAVGKFGRDYTKAMRDIINNPFSYVAKEYKGLTQLLNEAATIHAETHQRNLAEAVSGVIDNMQALATLHDELGLELVVPAARSNSNNRLLFNGVEKSMHSENILDFIHENYGESSLPLTLRTEITCRTSTIKPCP